MTTIAYTRGLLACDSCWTSDDTQEVSATKIMRLSSGALLGLSGDNDARELVALLDRAKTEKQLPVRSQLASLRGEFGGLLVLPNGKVFRISTGHDEKDKDADYGIWEINRGVAAAGSGSGLALGAMVSGKSAREAVAIACRFDINSRLPVHSLKLSP